MGVVIVHGDKGGVGKSTIAATYGEYVLEKGYPLTVIECDTQNPDVGRYFQARMNIQKIDLRQDAGWIALYNLLDEDPASDLIISLPAGIGPVAKKNAQDFIAACKGTKRQAAMLWVLGRTADSIALLRDTMEAYSSLPIVAVRNCYHTGGDPTRFARWEASKTREALLQTGGAEIAFPDLMDALFDATFAATPPVRFREATFRYGDRLRLDQWFQAACAAFEQVMPSLHTGNR